MYVKKKKSNRFGLQTAAPKISDQFWPVNLSYAYQWDPGLSQFVLNMDSKTFKTSSVHSLVLTAVLMKIQIFWNITTYIYSSLTA
jgi:hypothetical protein